MNIAKIWPMKINLTYVLFIFLATQMVSCAYNNEEELYPMESCDTTNVTYLATIVPIVTQHCYECHGGTAQVSGIPLEGHANIKSMIDAQRLLGAINHEVGFSPMPKDRQKLAACDILKIERWVSDGAPNN